MQSNASHEVRFFACRVLDATRLADYAELVKGHPSQILFRIARSAQLLLGNLKVIFRNYSCFSDSKRDYK